MARWLAGLLLVACAGADPDPDGEPDVVEPALLGILVTPETAVLPVGEQIQLRATGLVDDRTSIDLTAAVDWSSEAPSVADVSNDLDAEGLLIGASLGETRITAALEGVVSVPVTVRVTDATLVGLSVEPDAVSLNAGETVQLVATAAFSDGTRSDASSQVRWITGDAAVATLEQGGLLTAMAKGDTQVVARWDEAVAEPVPVHVLQAAKADLRVVSITGGGLDGELRAQVTIRNDGAVGAADFWVDGFLDPSSNPQVGDLGEVYVPVSYLGPGASRVVELDFPAGPGDHEVVIIVDTDELVDEQDEGNNTRSATLSVDGADAADLQIEAFDWIVDGSDVYYWAEIANQGDAAVGEFYVDLFPDRATAPPFGEVGEFVLVDGLEGWGTVEVEWLLEDLDCDPCRTWVLVDSDGDVDEADTTNNRSGPHTVVLEEEGGDTGDTGWW